MTACRCRAAARLGFITVLSLAWIAKALAQASVVWAVNVGGPETETMDGTRFMDGTGLAGGQPASEIVAVSGTQSPFPFRTYRSGELALARAVPNGTYDLTFLFAEPADIEPGERVFDVLVEDTRVIDDLDVLLFRDGRPRAGLSVTVPDVLVEDGELSIELEAEQGQPLLNGLIVRTPHEKAASWEPVWGDEFTVEGAPDPDNWNIEEWPPRRVNDEDQAYTGRPGNLRVDDGMLIIEAHRETYGEASYTSGRMHSQGKGGFLYGRVEVRAQLPRGQGTWPAIWMMPDDPFTYATTCDRETGWTSDPPCDAWPNSGEMDIMEHVGYQMNHVHGTMHTKAYYWKNHEQRKGRVLLDDVAEAFHVYALEWTPERIDVFVDDTLYFTYVNEHESWEQWPFDHPFHVILNVAVGGHWGRAGGPIDDRIFPQKMLVDYVRIYQAGDRGD